ncbi:MAG: glycosyltransferase [Chloroflexi bacterium]|nr:glycosyltransferase [Chloroflexota bacterium]
MQVLQMAYVLSAFGLALVGINALVLSALYWHHRHREAACPPQPDRWPTVVVQLPVYNEQHVVERLVDAACELNYPPEKLIIQLLDDSSDETLIHGANAVERARAAGITADHVLRTNRSGYKAGALAHGLEQTDAEFIAIFDADFIPPADFLKRTLPYFLADEDLGLIQTRWAHLNAEYSHLTRAQALALDAHFVVEQTARHRSGLLMNFAGTGGVWRRSCIEASGGWQHDTLSEDIDLSYRAQLAGWKSLYLPDMGVPGEIPPLMMGFKRQQSRWATGTVQCLRKLGTKVLKSSLAPWQKVQAVLHLSGYFIHPLMIAVLLLTLPLLLLGGLQTLPLAGLGIAMFGPPVQALLSQTRLYANWKERLFAFPLLMLMGIGIAVNNTGAVVRGLKRGEQPFRRTPKYGSEGTWMTSLYTLPADGSTWIEIALALYALVTTGVAISQASAVAPFMLLYAAGFTYVAVTSLSQTSSFRRGTTQVWSLSET